MTVPGLTLVKSEEIEQARELLRLSFRDYARGLNLTRQWSFGWLENSVRAHLVLFWNRKTGIVVFRPGSDGDRLDIHLIGLRPDLRGYGLGQAMLYTVEREIKERGYHWAELSCAQAYDQLALFFEKAGFQRCQVGKGHDDAPNVTHVFMEKPLTDVAKTLSNRVCKPDQARMGND